MSYRQVTMTKHMQFYLACKTACCLPLRPAWLDSLLTFEQSRLVSLPSKLNCASAEAQLANGRSIVKTETCEFLIRVASHILSWAVEALGSRRAM